MENHHRLDIQPGEWIKKTSPTIRWSIDSRSTCRLLEKMRKEKKNNTDIS